VWVQLTGGGGTGKHLGWCL